MAFDVIVQEPGGGGIYVLGSNVPSVVSIGKMSQEFKSRPLTNPTGAVFLIDFKVGTLK